MRMYKNKSSFSRYCEEVKICYYFSDVLESRYLGYTKIFRYNANESFI